MTDHPDDIDSVLDGLSEGDEVLAHHRGDSQRLTIEEITGPESNVAMQTFKFDNGAEFSGVEMLDAINKYENIELIE
jgi:hypothetical protein